MTVMLTFPELGLNMQASTTHRRLKIMFNQHFV